MTEPVGGLTASFGGSSADCPLAGNCERVACQRYDPVCYPNLPPVNYLNETTAVITSEPPPETTYAVRRPVRKQLN